MNFIVFLLRRFTTVAYCVHGIGLGRVCEFIRKTAAKMAPTEPLLIEDFQGHGKFWCYLQEHMGSQIFFRGAYSGDSLTVLTQYLKPDSVFIDIGANHGEFTVAAALLTPNGQTIAFEPVPKNIARLRINVQSNHLSNVQIMSMGLSDQEGTFPIYDQETPYDDGTTNEGLTSLFAAGKRSISSASITTRRLDDVWSSLGLNRVDMIKLDIEGAEWQALRGGQRLLERYKPILLVEVAQSTCAAAGYRANDFAQWIEDLGYRLFLICDAGHLREITPTKLAEFQNLLALPRL
jgi:FkbM family methyltransferase